MIDPIIVAFSPFFALLAGISLAVLGRQEEAAQLSKKCASKILGYAIIFLGFGFNLFGILKSGLEGLGATVVSISFTIALGLLIGWIFRNKFKVSILISIGTAICGGSAIAAIAPIIKSNDDEVAVSIAIIFLLNAVALVLFPYIGHVLDLTPVQFGTFAAMAIHDTASVVGSCLVFGQESLETGVTIKLVRALWILPLSLIISLIFTFVSQSKGAVPSKKPWFIVGFLAASLSITLFPDLVDVGQKLKYFGKILFAVALFLIGYNLSLKNIKSIGFGVLSQAILLWVIIVICILYWVVNF
ncbi:MAG: putative sulfate exporter family transporter [bacterium]|nr:putative sulfate exporter family transporter [bacterium]